MCACYNFASHIKYKTFLRIVKAEFGLEIKPVDAI